MLIKIVKIDTGNSYYYDEVTLDARVTSNIEWDEVTEEEYNEISKGLDILNSQRRYTNGFIYAIVSIPDQREIADLSLKAVREAIAKEKARLAKYEAERQRKQAEKEAKSVERKRKQLEKLKKELGEE